MLVWLEKSDALIIGRGLLTLALIIVFGVAAAESQLLELTQQHDFVQVFNIQQPTAGVYRAYVFGKQLNFNSAVTAGAITSAGRDVIIGIGDRQLTIPTAITVDITEEINVAQYWCRLWYNQFLAVFGLWLQTSFKLAAAVWAEIIAGIVN